MGDVAMTSEGVSRRVAYYFDEDVGAYAYTLHHPMKPHRIKMAHNLIVNYDLDQHMEILRPERATPQSMTKFHTDEFIDFLHTVTPETVDAQTGHGVRYLIGEDCPAFEGVFEFCSISAGGSISGAQRLNAGEADIAVNWAGGLHHAKKREASGFCYVNDIVLAILELLRYHARVLYIDIDIHHGDGVEEAFYSTDRVMTCSLHKFGDYFPGTGDVGDRGVGKGKGYAVNVPLRDGIDDETYSSIFRPVIQHIMDWYRPGAVVLQCGADSLAEDKLGCFNLSMQGHAACVRFVKSFNLPTIILGGGGYTIRNVARTWAYETGIACGIDLPVLLPFNEYIEHYGPEFKLDVPANNMDNDNSPGYINYIRQSVIDGLRDLPFAPGVGSHPTPRDAHNEPMDEDDADIRITQRQRDAHVSRYGDILSDSDDDMDYDGGLASASRRHGATVAVASALERIDDTTTRGGRRRQRRKHFDEESAEAEAAAAVASAVAASGSSSIAPPLIPRLPGPQLNGDQAETSAATTRVKRRFFRPSLAAAAVLPSTTSSVMPSAAAAPDRFLIQHTKPSGPLSNAPRGLTASYGPPAGEDEDEEEDVPPPVKPSRYSLIGSM